MRDGAVTAIRLHNGLAVPQRVITKFDQFTHGAELTPNDEELTPNWLSTLPAVIEAVCRKWQIELEPVTADTYMTLVLFGTSPDLGPVVIKSTPLAAHFVSQARAFEISAGENVPRIYDLDDDHCTMVMERIVPGTELADVGMDDETSTRIAAETLRTFWRPVSDAQGLKPQRHVMQPLFDWTPRPELIDTDLVAQAQQLAASLLRQSTQSCLLHGDFHHWNVLQRASGRWVIIDPQGHVGDTGSEIARWMHNPPEVATREDFLDVAERRLRIWADVTGIDVDDLASWTLAGNVLNAINCIALAPEVMQTCVCVAEHLQTFVGH